MLHCMPDYQSLTWFWYCPEWHTGPSMPRYNQSSCSISVIDFYFWGLCNYYSIAYSTIKAQKFLKVPTASHTTQKNNLGGLIIISPVLRQTILTSLCHLKVKVYKACGLSLFKSKSNVLLCLCLKHAYLTGFILQSTFWT